MVRYYYRVGLIGYLVGTGIEAAQRSEAQQAELKRQRIARGQHPDGLPAKFLRGPKWTVLAGAILFGLSAITMLVVPAIIGIVMMVVAGEVWSKRKKEADRYYINAQRLDQKDAAEGWQ